MVNITVTNSRTGLSATDSNSLVVQNGDVLGVTAASVPVGQGVDFQASANGTDPWITFMHGGPSMNGVVGTSFKVDASMLPFYVHARLTT